MEPKLVLVPRSWRRRNKAQKHVWILSCHGLPLSVFLVALAPFQMRLGSHWPSFGVPLAALGPLGLPWAECAEKAEAYVFVRM